MATSFINLLDLPGIILEKIFGYCLKANITEVNKFVKEFIENSRLMDRLVLKIQIDKESDSICEILQTCIASTRKFKTIHLHITLPELFYEIQDSDTKFKQLFDKQALTAREIDINFVYNDSSDLLKCFRLLENTKDLETLKCCLNRNWQRIISNRNINQQELIIEEDFIKPFPNHVEKLKDFHLEQPGFSASILTLFQDLKNLQKIRLHCLDFSQNKISKFQSLIENSSETLKLLSLTNFYRIQLIMKFSQC